MSQHIGKTKECNKVFSILVQSKEVQMLLESKLRGPRTRAAIASLLADADDDEDDATVTMSLGDDEDEELLTGGNLSSKERVFKPRKSSLK